jgi:hypothetical protein
MNNYYTYAYLRKDGTPYYIGKGEKNRAYRKNKGEVKPPKDKTRIIFLKENLTEEEAFRHEIYMIFVFGRKDLKTGILRNKTDGGEGPSGAVRSKETRKKMSQIMKGKNTKKGKDHPNYGKSHSEETKRKISEKLSGEKHPMYGKSHSEETKRKISEAHKGKIGRLHSNETKRKMRESNKGKNVGKKWWNNGKINKFTIECPGDNWTRGVIRFSKN